MGVFSWTCPHCDHSILVHAHRGINEWMTKAVVLEPCGDRMSGTYDGYGNLDDGEITDAMYSGAIMAHLACWEVAGSPEFGFYADKGLTSESAADQGYFFSTEHDLIDPRITDPAERELLLSEGRRAREAARFDEKARSVTEILIDARDLEPEDRWSARFGIWEPTGLMKGYAVTDKLGDLAAVDLATEQEAVATGRRLWGMWLESDEFKTVVARAKELDLECRAAALARLKEKGRFTVSYGPAKGDSITHANEPTWTGGRSIYRVIDALDHSFEKVFDGPNLELGVKTFDGDAPEHEEIWERRVNEMRASGRRSADLAKDEAARLNKEWADAGYPVAGLWLDPARPWHLDV
jgi:hypothetical protein